MKTSPDNLFRQHQRMIWSLANVFAQRSGIEVSDFESIGDEVFVHCLSRWDPARAAFGTLLYGALRNAFQDEVRKVGVRRTNERQYAAETNQSSTQPIDSLLRLADILVDIGADARETVRVLFKEPLRVAGGEFRKNVRAAIRLFLAEEECWGQDRIRTAFAELNLALA